MSHSILDVSHSRQLSMSHTWSYAFTNKDVFLVICEAVINVLPQEYPTPDHTGSPRWSLRAQLRRWKQAQTPGRYLVFLPCIHSPLIKVRGPGENPSCLGWRLVLSAVLGVCVKCGLCGRHCSRHEGHTDTQLKAKAETKRISYRLSPVIATSTGCAKKEGWFLCSSRALILR